MPGLSPTWRILRVFRSTLILTPWVVHLFVADIFLSALLPVSAVLPTLSYNVSSALAASVWLGIQFIFTRINHAKITIAGDRLPQGESAIVVCNHCEWTDFYMIQEVAIRAGMLGRCRWFAKQQLKWVPFLGWGLWAMGMPLVSRKWMQDKREIDRVFRGVSLYRWPMWLVSYSEATRFTPEKREEGVQWCKENGKAMPKHLLYPRTKGFVASVQELRKLPHVKAIYDMTIAYAKGNQFQSPPSFAESIMVPRLDAEWKFYVHVQRHLVSELPTSDDELAAWLVSRWIEKGERLEELREKHARGLAWEDD